MLIYVALRGLVGSGSSDHDQDPGEGGEPPELREHAPRVAPKLALRAKDLVLGVAEKEGDDVALVKKPAEVLPEGVACGFEGRPDSSGMYRKIGQTTANSDPTAILGKNFGD